MRLPIADQLDIKSTPVIFWQGEVWPDQGLLRFKTTDELEAIIADAKKKHGKYLFQPLTIDLIWYLTLRDVRIGARLDHGNNGKKGLSFPVEATRFHKSEDEAKQALAALIDYFNDMSSKEFSLVRGSAKPGKQDQFDSTNAYLFDK